MTKRVHVSARSVLLFIFYKVLYLYLLVRYAETSKLFEEDIYQPPQTMTHIWKSSVVVTKERC